MKKTLVYIIGAGRSGTTILDIVLGNSKNTISLGEINRFFKRKGIPPKRNKTEKVALFWKKIKVQFEKKSLQNILDYEKEEKLATKNEYHSSFLKSILNLNDKEYKESMNVLYDAVLKNTAEHTLIESSKYPLRALNLSRIKGKDINIKFIYLKKDPIKVVKSFGKKGLEQPPKGFLASNIYYFTINLMCSFVLFYLKVKKHKISKIKHEDLLMSYEKTLKKLSKDLDEKFDLPIELIKNNQPLRTGYLFDGNRIRLKETIFLQTDIQLEKKNFKYYFTRGLNYLIYN